MKCLFSESLCEEPMVGAEILDGHPLPRSGYEGYQGAIIYRGSFQSPGWPTQGSIHIPRMAVCCGSHSAGWGGGKWTQKLPKQRWAAVELRLPGSHLVPEVGGLLILGGMAAFFFFFCFLY